MTTINGEKPQEPGPSGAPAKKPVPFKRGVRRGDVLLMVAKLDSDSAKPHDAPTCKTSPPATDPGGGEKGEPPLTPHGPQASTEDTAPKAEETQTGGVGDPGTVLLTKDEKGTAGKGGGAPQTKGLKGGEPQGKEGPGEGERPRIVEKRGGDPPTKMAKGNISKDVRGERKLAGAQIQVKKWGGSLSRSRWDGPQREKGKEGVLPSKAKKTDGPQMEAEKMESVQGEVGTVGEAPRGMEKAGGAQSEPREAGKVGSETEKGCEAPKEVDAHRETPVAVGKGGHPDSRGQRAEEPCVRVDNGAEAPKMELQGPSPPALESRAERPPTQQENPEGPALQEAGREGQSRDVDQVRGLHKQIAENAEPPGPTSEWGQGIYVYIVMITPSPSGESSFGDPRPHCEKLACQGVAPRVGAEGGQGHQVSFM